MSNKTNQSIRKQAVEKFWGAVPPFWFLFRSQLDKTAREDYEITGGHFHILRRIKKGDTNISDLAESRHISRPVVSRKVDSLVEKGLVSRHESPEDRRFTVLELTPEGDRILEELRVSNRSWLDSKLSSLNKDELETILKAFEIFNKLSK